MKIAVFWVVPPCSLVKVYQRFRGPCCLHHQGATTQKTAILYLVLVLRLTKKDKLSFYLYGRNFVGNCAKYESSQ
jgi:hypothetical protein